ncbi:hypothetical protein ACFL9U_14060 [Thermodesulfobacteriota bacterium]
MKTEHKSSIIAILFAVLFINGAVTCSSSSLIPVGWRMPEVTDYSEITISLHNNEPPAKVIADFDGDGFIDQAYILINDKQKKWGLFVFWRLKSGQGKIQEIDEHEFDSQIHMGISLLSPGSHKTACGLGYYECEAGEPTEIKLSNPGIGYFVIGSAYSVYFWDDKGQKLKQVWLSD